MYANDAFACRRVPTSEYSIVLDPVKPIRDSFVELDIAQHLKQ
jgi:hypothetical protein